MTAINNLDLTSVEVILEIGVSAAKRVKDKESEFANALQKRLNQTVEYLGNEMSLTSEPSDRKKRLYSIQMEFTGGYTLLSKSSIADAITKAIITDLKL